MQSVVLIEFSEFTMSDFLDSSGVFRVCQHRKP